MRYKDNIWVIWPDNFMCELSELSQFQHRSDDYKIIEVLEYDRNGEPSRYIDYKEM